MVDEPGADLLEHLGLTEYEGTALTKLLELGRTTAPDLAEATGIPKARIYGVLDSLADEGYVKIIPGRPKVYQPKEPADILDRAVENRRQDYESYRESVEDLRSSFLERFQPRYESASEDIRPAEELFYVVDVGRASERETRQLYHDAEREVCVLSKSFAFFEAVEPAVRDALDRGVSVSAILHHPDRVEPEKRERHHEVVSYIRESYPAIDLRYSTEALPWRGTFVDPSPDYSTGRAILATQASIRLASKSG